jgi:hypothetical protein
MLAIFGAEVIGAEILAAEAAAAAAAEAAAIETARVAAVEAAAQEAARQTAQQAAAQTVANSGITGVPDPSQLVAKGSFNPANGQFINTTLPPEPIFYGGQGMPPAVTSPVTDGGITSIPQAAPPAAPPSPPPVNTMGLEMPGAYSPGNIQGASPNFFNPSATVAPGQAPLPNPQYQLNAPTGGQSMRLGSSLESITAPGPINSVLPPPSGLEAGFDKAVKFAEKNPFTAMTGAYMGASALGLLNPSNDTFNQDKYDGPLSKYRLSPNFQAGSANPANFQYRPRYAAGGGIMGAGSYDIPVGYDEGGRVTEAQKDAAKQAFELANPGGLGPSVNVGGYGTLNFQNDAAYDQFNQNPQSMTFSQGPGGVRYVEPKAADYDTRFQDLSMGMGGGGGKYFDDQSMATMAMAKGGSLSESIESYQKMLAGKPQAAPARSADVGIYYDQDPDTRYQDALTAAQIRQSKVNQRAYVSPPAAKRPTPMGQLQMASVKPRKQSDDVEAASGGIMQSSLGGYAAGGNPRLLKGPGDGMSDNIPATINRRQPARLADGEFVIPADVVSHLGNGSTEAGAKQLHAMMDKVRKARTGNPKQGKQIKPQKYMPK